MTHYENVFIARQEVSAAQVDALADGFAEIITAGGGTIHRREYWGLKGLSYKIKKNRKAHFVLFNIEATSQAVREMERNMSLSEDILRHLTIRTDEAPEGPSAMMQGRGERERAQRDSDDRPARSDDRSARSDGRPARSDDKPARSDGRPARSDDKPVQTNDKAAKSDDKAAKSDDKAAKSDDKPEASEKAEASEGDKASEKAEASEGDKASEEDKT